MELTTDWEERVKSALRLLADSGFGGERSRGWGRASEPEFSDAASLFGEAGHPGAWWMLSLYSPHAEDTVDWSRGDYAIVTRAGWTDSAAAGSAKKKQVRMIEEGSVLMAPGTARPRRRCGARRFSASRMARGIRARGSGAA